MYKILRDVYEAISWKILSEKTIYSKLLVQIKAASCLSDLYLVRAKIKKYYNTFVKNSNTYSSTERFVILNNRWHLKLKILKDRG